MSLTGQEKRKTIGTDGSSQPAGWRTGDRNRFTCRAISIRQRLVTTGKHREKSAVKHHLRFVHKFFLSTLKFCTEAVDISVHILLRTPLNAVNTPAGKNRAFFTQPEKTKNFFIFQGMARVAAGSQKNRHGKHRSIRHSPPDG
ncbi:hypothetical protein [Thalassolituus sp. C2-1]|uniref:hypothetical protein n=1 Tax=Venatorbacter sp. C2-1 TaxID=2597518 RepID=UPI0011922326|nr:hypothetical protein [Thalassolituus sp. C2-1]TVV45943.1 hypothetical protein FOT50_03685 [Thalassolituus sp. C2-1]